MGNKTCSKSDEFTQALVAQKYIKIYAGRRLTTDIIWFRNPRLPMEPRKMFEVFEIFVSFSVGGARKHYFIFQGSQ